LSVLEVINNENKLNIFVILFQNLFIPYIDTLFYKKKLNKFIFPF